MGQTTDISLQTLKWNKTKAESEGQRAKKIIQHMKCRRDSAVTLKILPAQ